MRRAIVNIRGPNAAGKTTLARMFAQGTPMLLARLPVDGKQIDILAHRSHIPGLELPVTVLGPYDERKYSGCDAIKSADAICEAVKLFASQDSHLIFEGFRVSKSWERFATLRNEIVRADPGISWTWALLNADHKLVVERATARREEGVRPVDPVELAAVCRQMNNTRVKALAAFPRETLVMDPTRAPQDLYEDLLGRIKLAEVS